MAVVELAVNSELISTFIFYAAVLVLKMLIMSPLTGRQRMKKGVFLNKEDAAWKPDWKVKFDDPDVERVRRAHQNDLENILPFLVLGLLYCLSGAPVAVAAWHFRIFAVARIFHTVIYLGEVPQPARGTAQFVGLLVCFSMALQLIWKNLPYL